MNRLSVIQSVIDKVVARTYLEIGVEYGTVFSRIRAAMKIAVDPALKISLAKKLYDFRGLFSNKYFNIPSDQFFKEHADKVLAGRKVDVAFIDGLHTYEQTYRDVINTLEHLDPKGVIIMHDCNPPTERSATRSEDGSIPISGGAWCGDTWKAIVRLRSLHPELEVCVLDTDYGLGIVRKSFPENRLAYSLSEIDRLSYQDLDRDRKKILNLKSVEQFGEILAKLSAISK